MKDLSITFGGYLILTLVVSVPAALFLETSQLMRVAGITFLAGASSGAVIFIDRPPETAGVYGRFLLGILAKVAGLAAVYLLVDGSNASPKAVYGPVLACYLLYFVWTTHRFHVVFSRS